MSSECSGETVPSVFVNDIMCCLIRLQKPVHSRLFEACADPEDGAGGTCTPLLTHTCHQCELWEHSGPVVECLTRDREAASSSLIGVTALSSLSKTHLS